MSIGCKIFENETLNKVYDLLDNVTPLKTDCGKLCGSKCCSGSKKDGMLLFPGEEKFFQTQEGFSVNYDNRYDSFYVICNGTCSRDLRPLSCRIFPYFIYMKNCGDELKIIPAPDIRAIDYCPLTLNKIKADRSFIRTLRIAGKIMESDEDIKNYTVKISEILTDFGKL